VDPERDGAGRRRRGLSQPSQRVLWGTLVGVAGIAFGWDLAAGRGARLLVALIAAACGAAFAETLSRALPLFGIALGPLTVLIAINLQRLTSSEQAFLPDRGRAGSASPPLGYLTAGLAMLASAVSASILLWALSRSILGERRPLRRSAKSLAWTCFWIALAMVLISNFAA
jgi:hypothetical protein